MTRASNVVNVNDPKANMYGCLPCPKCKSAFRYVVKNEALSTERGIICDDCGYVEDAVVEEM